MALVIEIDQHSDMPIYEQLRRRVIAAIAHGELRPGARLPSVRSLAVDLGVNLHTVNKAYALLRDDGYITMRRGSGASVTEPAGPGIGMTVQLGTVILLLIVIGLPFALNALL